MSNKDIIKEVLRKGDIKFLVKQLFKFSVTFEPTPGQVDIIRRIAFAKDPRMAIRAMTRYGKSKCVSVGVGLYLLLNENKKIALIGPQKDQAQILRNYLADAILSCEPLRQLLLATHEELEDMKKERSKNRMTFSNGCELQIFSAYGDANRLMGFGADLVIIDEAALVSRTAYAKIMRMLGDHPEESVIIELYNPWDSDSKAYEHSIDTSWKVIKIGWRQALAEGRTTQEFVDEQRKELSPLEFTVLYESDFPDQASDSLYSLAWLIKAENQQFGLERNLQELLARMERSQDYTETQYKRLKEELKNYRRIISEDPADEGVDESVILWWTVYKTKWELIGCYSEPKSDPMNLVGKAMHVARRFIGLKVKGIINLDRVGIGSGPLSRMKELKAEKGLKNLTITGCHNGETAIEKDIYTNKKSENFHRSSRIFRDELIDISVLKRRPEYKEAWRKVRKQVMTIKWEFTSSGKKKIIDPKSKTKKSPGSDNKSPDWADALMYGTWKDSKTFVSAWV